MGPITPCRFSLAKALHGAEISGALADGSLTDADLAAADAAGDLRTPNGAANARVSFVSGLAEEAVLVDYVEACNLAPVLNAYCSIGFALDSTTVFDRLEQPTNASNAAVLTANVTLPHAYLPQLGAHFVQALEGGDGTNAATFIGGAKMNLRLTMSF
jgi:hypothetical protein